MNETGRRMLVNSIAYIARFTEDRPIAPVHSPFAGAKWVTPKGLRKWMLQYKDSFDYYVAKFDPAAIAHLKPHKLENILAWIDAELPYLGMAPDGSITLIGEAKDLGVDLAAADLPDRIATLCAAKETATTAAALAAKVIVGAPSGLEPQAWAAWIKESRPYLFHAPQSGARWFLDPLAKKRQVPTKDLRGPARADRR